ncbi:GntR family transcriptional regulator [Acuticoccus sp. M5D2P5]|uniref:GntR family transcriptional regulator n=1 Tax=Acuticoccus kalidii TaxID=2910977 RepID=UPI001F177207|nr:GntR family transcriptional regulator [Acuticoccus kalidii]MCF3933249.1 GntR family transcriptional regulator [Acuticoccus kalidii]
MGGKLRGSATGETAKAPRERASDRAAVRRGRGLSEAPSPSQADAALDLLRARIIDLTLEPGSRIDERLLVERFGLGRTPAREALNRLAAEGFVRILPQRGGTYVRKLDIDEMGEVLIAQQLAESIAAQMCRLDDPDLIEDLRAIQADYRQCVAERAFLAITQLNHAFHLRIHQTIGNWLLYEHAQNVHHHVQRLLLYIYKAETREPTLQSAQFASNLEQHDEIIDVLAAGDRERLIVLLPDHSRYTKHRLVQLLQSRTVDTLVHDVGDLDMPIAT